MPSRRTYRSASARPCCGPAPSSASGRRRGRSTPRYCDSIPPNVRDPRIIGQVIDDLARVYEKTFGETANYKAKCKTVQNKCADIQDELDDCEDCRRRLQQEVRKLQAELCAAARALEDEIQRRVVLEGFVSKLKAHLSRLQATCNADARDKNKLANCLKAAEEKLKELTEVVQCLEMERDRLLRNCKGLEEMRSRESENITTSSNRCEELAEALTKCCHSNEELQAEIRRLKDQIKKLLAKMKQLEKERKCILEELKRERVCWSAEKDRFLKMINDLQKALNEQKAKNQDICQQMKSIVAAHHSALEALRKEVEKYKGFYEAEKAERERLEKALRDCEERKAKMLKERANQKSNKTNLSTLDPCDPAFLEHIRAEWMSDKPQKSSNASINSKNSNEKQMAAALEKELQDTKKNLNEKAAALEKTQQKVKKSKIAYKNLEVELNYNRGEFARMKAELEKDLQNANANLNEQSSAHQKSQEEVKQLQAAQQSLEVELNSLREELIRIKEDSMNSNQHIADKESPRESSAQADSTPNTTDVKENFRRLKQEVKAERELVYRLKYKSEVMRDQLRKAREQIKEMSKRPQTQNSQTSFTMTDKFNSNYESQAI